MTWALLWLFYLASFLHLSLSLSRRKSDIIKQKGPKKKKRDQREMLFFFSVVLFPTRTQKSTKRERGLFEPFVLSNENEGLIIINRQKHRAPLKPLEEEEEDSEDEDGTQTLLETVRVLHRALQSEFFRFCTGALQQSRLRAARVLDRHRRIEIRELARVVRGGLSFSFFFSLSCVLFVASLCPFFVVVVVCGFTDDDDDILSLWDAILKRRRRGRRKTPFACDDQGSSMSTLDDDDDAPFVVALEQRGDAI